MIVSDGRIRWLLKMGMLSIEPFDETLIQPASVDLRLSTRFQVLDTHRASCIDPFDPPADVSRLVTVEPEQPFIVHPGEFVLASTVERVELGDDLVARVDGKSSLGRWGLLIHATAGFVDPGFRGQITLELTNVARLPIKLWPFMAICQISFIPIESPALRPYGSPGLNSKYQDQDGPVTSRYARNLRPEVAHG